jgi:alpha-tubulin suppressor-like RCC1 family protein
MVPSPPGVRFAEITSGEDFIIALDEQRRMWIWGNGLNGMLGDGLTGESHYSSSPLMLTVPGVSGWRYVKVGNGSRHVIAIANDGSLWTWGMNHRGQLGHGEFDFPGFEGNNVAPPRNVMPGSTWLSANAGGWFSQAIREDSVFLGTLWGWGDNRYYQLGLGFDTPGQLGIHTPQRVQLTDQQPFSIGF